MWTSSLDAELTAASPIKAANAIITDFIITRSSDEGMKMREEVGEGMEVSRTIEDGNLVNQILVPLESLSLNASNHSFAEGTCHVMEGEQGCSEASDVLSMRVQGVSGGSRRPLRRCGNSGAQTVPPVRARSCLFICKHSGLFW